MVSITRFFGTLWCSDCKRSKAFLAEHRIPYEYIDIDEDEEAAKFVQKVNNGKRKVPTIEFSDGTYLVEPTNAELAEKLGLIKKPDHEKYDVLIVGSGPAGLTCAIYTAREGLDTIVIEKSALGGKLGFTERIENYPGFPQGIMGEELAQRFAEQAERFGVELLKATKVSDIQKKEQSFEVTTSTGYVINTKVVVIATGSEYRKLGIEGEEELFGYKIHFCATCDGPFYKDKKVLVVGGGNSALEESLFLARFASEVTVTELMDHLTASAVIQQKIAENPKIKTFTSYEIKKFIAGPRKTLEGVLFYDRANNKEVIFKPDGVFVFVGLKPNAKLVEHLVDLDKRGFIVTDSKMMTRTPGLFAIGDCRGGSTQQAASAVGEGAIVALKIRDYLNTP
ncbi:MAG: FAD-dependent oxidoreductase [Candidatus Heimdallarchaeaceae archaeon]